MRFGLRRLVGDLCLQRNRGGCCGDLLGRTWKRFRDRTESAMPGMSYALESWICNKHQKHVIVWDLAAWHLPISGELLLKRWATCTPTNCIIYFWVSYSELSKGYTMLHCQPCDRSYHFGCRRGTSWPFWPWYRLNFSHQAHVCFISLRSNLVTQSGFRFKRSSTYLYITCICI